MMPRYFNFMQIKQLINFLKNLPEEDEVSILQTKRAQFGNQLTSTLYIDLRIQIEGDKHKKALKNAIVIDSVEFDNL